MARHLFIGQQTLSTWVEQDKVDFDNNIMTIKADGRSFRLVEAVRFIRVEGGDEDKPGMLGRVKTNRQLEEMGAERYRDSVIFREVAYKVQEGFIGEVFLREDVPSGQVQAPATASPRVPTGARKPEPAIPAPKPVVQKKDDPGEDVSDEELLIEFLLNNPLK